MLSVGVLGACGDDEVDEITFLAPSTTPLALNDAIRGVRAEPFATFQNNLDIFERDLQSAKNVVIQLQIHSEYAQQRNSSFGFTFADQLRATRGAADGRGGELIETAEREWWVLDLQRLDREWLVDWAGLSRDEPDNRLVTFSVGTRYLDHAADYPNAVRGGLTAALATASRRPHAVILGAELDRYWVQNPGDWPYVVRLLDELAAAAREAHPDVRVGVGFNWSSFVDELVPSTFGDSGRSTVDYLAVQHAWDTVIRPVYFSEDGAAKFDFYAFSSAPVPARYGGTPGAIPDTHYAFLPTLFRVDPSQRLPVAWYGLDWPNDGHTPQSDGEFLGRFLALNGGYDVSLVSWAGFADLLAGSECAANLIAAVPAPRSFCYRGMYPDVPQFTSDTAMTRAFFGRR
jgi:hypothetical protein